MKGIDIKEVTETRIEVESQKNRLEVKEYFKAEGYDVIEVSLVWYRHISAEQLIYTYNVYLNKKS